MITAQQRPLSCHLLFRTSDVDVAQERMGEIVHPHFLDTASRVETLDSVCTHARLGNSSLTYIDYGAPASVRSPGIKNTFVVTTALSGKLAFRCRPNWRLIRPGTMMLPPPDEHWAIEMAGVSLLVTVKRKRLEHHLGALLGRLPDQPLEFEAMPSADSSRYKSWERALAYVLGEVNAEGILAHGHAACQLDQLLMSALLHTLPHNYSDILISRTALDPIPDTVQKVDEYIDCHCGEHISIQDLARAANVSARTLHKTFQHQRNTSPMQYLKSKRMERVHKALKEGCPSNTVTKIALDWGFTQLGRFSVEYRKRYGESPSETLRY